MRFLVQTTRPLSCFCVSTFKLINNDKVHTLAAMYANMLPIGSMLGMYLKGVHTIPGEHFVVSVIKSASGAPLKYLVAVG